MAIESPAGGVARQPTPLAQTDFQRRVYCVLGLPFDAVTRREAVGIIAAARASRSRCFFSTPNLNFLIASQRDPAFRDSVIRSDLSVADGQPVVWLARLLGVPIAERVAGADLFEDLVRGKGGPLSVFLFGAPEGVAEVACQRLNAQMGSVRCAGFDWPGNGTVDQMSTRPTIEKINRSAADFVVVSLGAKKGQAWIERNRTALDAPVISHLGAVVNFIAGTVSRAPTWMRKIGLEWLWRIKEEPSLWRRYFSDALTLSRFVSTCILPSLSRRVFGSFGGTGEVPGVISTYRDGRTCLTLSGAWSESDVPALRDALGAITREAGDIELDLTALDAVDASFIGSLMLLYGHQSRLGAALRVLSPGMKTGRAFDLCLAGFLLNGLVARSGSS